MCAHKTERYPELLQDLHDIMVAELCTRGTDAEQAQLIAEVICESLRARWAGMQIYICKAKSYAISQRDRNVWADFDGRNHHYLTQKYDISLQQVYTIIKRQRKAQQREQQDDLFGE